MSSFRLLRDSLRPPKLRGGLDDRERHATWLELLYDLVYVAAIAQLATALYENLDPAGIARFIALFVPIWWSWVGHTFYLTRFDSEDLGQRLNTALQMVVVAFLAAFVPEAFRGEFTGFVASYCLVRLILVAQYVRAGRHIPEVQPLTRRYATGFAFAVAVWMASLLFQPPWNFAIWAIAILIDIGTPFTAGKLHLKFPPHLVHLPERFGLFTIIVLGESIVALIVTAGSKPMSLASGLALVAGLVVALSVWAGYFVGAHAAEARDVQAIQNVRSYQRWLYSHLPLAIGIVGFASAVKGVIKQSLHTPMSPANAWLLAGSLALAIVSLNQIVFSNPMGKCTRSVALVFVGSQVFSVGVLASAFVGQSISGTAMLGAIMVLNAIQAVFVLRIGQLQTSLEP